MSPSIEEGFDCLDALFQARDQVQEALASCRAGLLPGAGRVSNALREIDMAIDAVSDLLRMRGELE